MRKQPPTIEWHIAESDAEWARLSAQQTDAAAPLTAQQQPFCKSTFRAIILALALLLMTSGWWWRMVQSRSQPDAPTVAREQSPAHQTIIVADYDVLVTRVRHDLRREVASKDSSVLTGIPINAASGYLEPAIAIVKSQDDWAVISIVTPAKDGWLGCPEQRLYHHTASGWHQAVLDEKVLAALRQQKTLPAPFGAVCN